MCAAKCIECKGTDKSKTDDDGSSSSRGWRRAAKTTVVTIVSEISYCVRRKTRAVGAGAAIHNTTTQKSNRWFYPWPRKLKKLDKKTCKNRLLFFRYRPTCDIVRGPIRAKFRCQRRRVYP